SYTRREQNAIAVTVRVQITNLVDPTINTSSEANFKIKSALTVTAPNGAETWIVGENRNITWTRIGSIANVKLEYSTDGGTTYPNVITASTPASAGSYAWLIPDPISAPLMVRGSAACD